MKLVTALALAALPGASPPSDLSLTHSVDEGTRIETTLSHDLTMELVSGAALRGDQEQPMPEGFSMEINHTRTLRVTDVYGPPDGARPGSVLRTIGEYDDLMEASVVDAGGEPEEVSMGMESVLVDEPVAWTLGEEGYGAELADEESDVDPELLEGLCFDLDGLGLLPGEGADLEGGWTVPASALRDLLSLGGYVPHAPVEEPDDEGACFMRSLVMLPQLGELDGEVTVALVEHDQEAGLARLSLEAELSGEHDSAAYAKLLGAGIGDRDLEDLESLVMETELVIEGTVVWNVAGNRLSRFDLDGDLTRTATLDAGREDVDMRVLLEFRGEASWELEFEDR